MEFIHAKQQDTAPFFLYLTPYAAHRPHVPAPRHLGAFKGAQAPAAARTEALASLLDSPASLSASPCSILCPPCIHSLPTL